VRTAIEPPEASPTKRHRTRRLSRRQMFPTPGPSQTADSTGDFLESEEDEEGEMYIDSPLQPDINSGWCR
jgi:hypothetical protein